MPNSKFHDSLRPQDETITPKDTSGVLHTHSHNHETPPAHRLGGHVHATGDKLKWAFVATLLILVVEVIGGSLANSLALISDAGHVLTDVAALALAWFAAVQAQKSPTLKHTFGYHRTGVLAALANSVTLIVIALIILFEAFHRFQHPEPVQSTILYISAGFGLIVNLGIALAFQRGTDNLNVRSALLHVLGDAAASAGVILGGIVMSVTHWYIIDPLLSVLIALVISWGAWRIVKEALRILMEGTPEGFDSEALIAYVQTLPGTCGIHDLHVWSLTSERVALSCHILILPHLSLNEGLEITQKAKAFLLQRLNISHTTIELETAQCPCTSLLCHETLWDPLLHDHERR